MKIITKRVVLDIGGTTDKPELSRLIQEVDQQIRHMDNPKGSGEYHLFNEKKSNGVKPIKDDFMAYLRDSGWILEHRLDVGVTPTKPGPLDATIPYENKYVALEWETGNISSSHRAINKMVSGLLKGVLICGILVLPSRAMYEYLTDRVGNFRELEPYFPVWSMANYDIPEGCIIIYEIEHDALSSVVGKHLKGTDGRALR